MGSSNGYYTVGNILQEKLTCQLWRNKMPPSKDDNTILISVFMALEGLFAYSAFLPSIMTVGTFVDTPAKVKMIRQGELVGTFFLVVLAILTAKITRSAWPMIMGVMAGVVALGIYEFSLRQSPAWNGNIGNFEVKL